MVNCNSGGLVPAMPSPQALGQIVLQEVSTNKQKA